jgi:hypothetical protein
VRRYGQYKIDRTTTVHRCTAWPVAEVGKWLGEIGLAAHAPAFAAQAMDGVALLSLKDTRDRSLSFPDFQRLCETKLGVVRLGDVLRLERALGRLGDQ